ncbi:uncharacterized protein Bfra_010937ia [Botrytis fragariae]|uniref:Uncharacterized protein n=1 Tax=Botrytis fragariae TaxID=1964551 RepID=A0A8H6ALC3_9HELO|nr:uncharacterized protein Bfra_010937ia [Botrytis fragariae]KAF5869737.1 hypothetical protein Bfra_010937ia [Botrytis fragariae]
MKKAQTIRGDAVAVEGTSLKSLFSAMVATGPVHMLSLYYNGFSTSAQNPQLQHYLSNYGEEPPSASFSTSSKRGSSKSKPKPLENLGAANKLTSNTGLFSPASSDENLSANDSDFEDSDEELVEVTLQPQSRAHNLDFYKDKMEDLAKTYKEIIDRRSFPEAQRASPYLSRTSSSSSCSSQRHDRPSQDDISHANLLLLLRMVE